MKTTNITLEEQPQKLKEPTAKVKSDIEKQVKKDHKAFKHQAKLSSEYEVVL